MGHQPRTKWDIVNPWNPLQEIELARKVESLQRTKRETIAFLVELEGNLNATKAELEKLRAVNKRAIQSEITFSGVAAPKRKRGPYKRVEGVKLTKTKLGAQEIRKSAQKRLDNGTVIRPNAKR